MVVLFLLHYIHHWINEFQIIISWFASCNFDETNSSCILADKILTQNNGIAEAVSEWVWVWCRRDKCTTTFSWIHCKSLSLGLEQRRRRFNKYMNIEHVLCVLKENSSRTINIHTSTAHPIPFHHSTKSYTYNCVQVHGFSGLFDKSSKNFDERHSICILASSFSDFTKYQNAMKLELLKYACRNILDTMNKRANERIFECRFRLTARTTSFYSVWCAFTF